MIREKRHTPAADFPTIMSLSFIPNTLDDATHEALDRKVNDDVLPCIGEKPWSLGEYLLLLITIVEFSNGTLDPRYASSRASQALMMSHPELDEMLHAALDRKSYRDIRNLDILQAPRQLTTESSYHFYYMAFISPYRGQAVDAFCEYLENNNNKFAREYDRAKYYGKFCSIVQSSGTGKSRLLLELRTKGVVVLYMNLPPSADKTDFPPRDVLPAEILTANLGSKADYSARCCAFFVAVFTMINPL
ncbi:hypothetical protein EDC04DRAFT_1000431 [Pisolithus marmoratus]|nr:hypothetical protein EDC04DRAFT_1000431 [Pisolithus marmoratus]